MAQIVYSPKLHFVDDNGNALTGGKLFVYNAGTTTKATIYSDNGLSISINNPVILNSRGEPTSNGSTPCDIWANTNLKFVLAPATDTDPPTSPIWTSDNIPVTRDLYDTNNNPVLKAGTVVGAVNYITVKGGATGTNGQLAGTGGDSNVGVDLRDSNNNKLIETGAVASAVNFINVTNAITATDPIIQAKGSDTNVSVAIKGKGTGAVKLGQSTSTDVRMAADQPIADSSGNAYIKFNKVASAVNSMTVGNNSTGLGPTLTASGETNVPITVAGKGTGYVGIGQNTTTDMRLVADQPVADSSGNAYLKFSKAATAVNSITVGNAAAGNNPSLTATGETNLGFVISSAGNGSCVLKSPASSTLLNLIPNSATSNFSTTFVSGGSFTANRTITLPNADISTFALQQVRFTTGSVATGTTIMPDDDTSPQNTEGDQYMSLSITPKSSTSVLQIYVTMSVASTIAAVFTAALFQDSTATCLVGKQVVQANTNAATDISFSWYMTSGTTSSTTFKVRAGAHSANTTTFNGVSGGRKLGGSLASAIYITEWSA